MYLLALFIVQNFKKNLRADPVMTMRNFWAKNRLFAPNNFFLEKIINIIFIYLLATFIVQISKTFLQRIQS